MSMSVHETLITASKCVLIPMGAFDVLATLDTLLIVMEELAEVASYNFNLVYVECMGYIIVFHR